MGFIEALAAASGLRQFAKAAAFDMTSDFRELEPGLDMPWPPRGEPAAEDADDGREPAPRELFLVCEQSGATSRGEPVFSSAFASTDDDLALSEDGYLINGSGQFLLGIPLGEHAKPAARSPQIVRLPSSAIETTGTTRISYKANLPAYPMTANADFDTDGSELLDRHLFARDPAVQASGIVLGDDRLKFLDRSLAGGSIELISPDGRKVQLVLRWAKMTSLRSAGRDCWNLFYRVRRDARPGEVAWKNAGHSFSFSADGRLDDASLVLPVIDTVIDGVRMGNVSLIFGAGGITQFADRGGLVKVLKSEADGCIGGTFTGVSMSGRGRLFAHYSNGVMRSIADIQFTGEESWFHGDDENDTDRWPGVPERKVA
jgi:flagellar hook protein FlgE